MHGLAAILGQSIGELECIELNVGVSMGKALDQGLDGGLGTIGVAGDAIANLHDGGPVLGGEVLVCRLGDGLIVRAWSRCSKHDGQRAVLCSALLCECKSKGILQDSLLPLQD